MTRCNTLGCPKRYWGRESPNNRKSGFCFSHYPKDKKEDAYIRHIKCHTQGCKTFVYQSRKGTLCDECRKRVRAIGSDSDTLSESEESEPKRRKQLPLIATPFDYQVCNHLMAQADEKLGKIRELLAEVEKLFAAKKLQKIRELSAEVEELFAVHQYILDNINLQK